MLMLRGAIVPCTNFMRTRNSPAGLASCKHRVMHSQLSEIDRLHQTIQLDAFLAFLQNHLLQTVCHCCTLSGFPCC